MRVRITFIVAATMFALCAHKVDHLQLQPERETTLHVGQIAAVWFPSDGDYATGSGSGPLVLVQQLTNKDGSTVYLYRAAHAGRDTLVATPVDRQAGQCISCVTRHYFITVVP